MAKPRPKKLPELEQWDDVKLFLQVARSGSFTAASRQLEIEQSTVSRRMAGLEAQLAAPLFERRPNGSTLTPFGERMKQHAEAMEAQLHALLDQASHHEREVEGVVRLALTESIAVHAIIPRILPKLYREFPKLSIELSTGYEVAELGHRHAELALRFFRPRSGDVVAQRIVTMQTALIAHERFRDVPIGELPLITVELPHVAAVEAQYLSRHFKRAPRLVTTGYTSQIAAVRAGLGAALLTRSLLRADKRLVELELGLPAGPVLELWLVAPTTLRHVPRVATVWAALEAGLGFLDA